MNFPKFLKVGCVTLVLRIGPIRGLMLTHPSQRANHPPRPLKVDWGPQAVRLLKQDLPKTAEGLAGVRDLPAEWSEGAEWSDGWALVSGASVGIGF